MEGRVRKSFQGVWNIIRFNWHFYVLSIGGILLMSLFGLWLPVSFLSWWRVLIVLIAASIFISLTVSFYIYDCSALYAFDYLPELANNNTKNFVNIHAGFDETSESLTKKYHEVNWQIWDFYDPEKHTEISIKRARRAYPAYPGTLAVSTDNLPAQGKSIDVVFLLFAAHEIRNVAERKQFFCALNKVLKVDGKIVVLEHQRDLLNFLVYTIGFLHFFSASSWKRIFEQAGFALTASKKKTPFVTVYFLEKNGNTA